MYPVLQRPRQNLSYIAESVFPHAEDKTITALKSVSTDRSSGFKTLGSSVPPLFAIQMVFPSSDYYEGSVPHPSFPGLDG